MNLKELSLCNKQLFLLLSFFLLIPRPTLPWPPPPPPPPREKILAPPKTYVNTISWLSMSYQEAIISQTLPKLGLFSQPWQLANDCQQIYLNMRWLLFLYVYIWLCLWREWNLHILTKNKSKHVLWFSLTTTTYSNWY